MLNMLKAIGFYIALFFVGLVCWPLYLWNGRERKPHNRRREKPQAQNK